MSEKEAKGVWRRGWGEMQRGRRGRRRLVPVLLVLEKRKENQEFKSSLSYI